MEAIEGQVQGQDINNFTFALVENLSVCHDQIDEMEIYYAR